MAWDQQHKVRSRQRIIDSAARLFTTKGFDHVGIDEVMADAGLTRGAFYSHFSTKVELYSEAIIAGARKGKSLTEHCDCAQDIIREYLSQEHVAGNVRQCPLAFLVSDISKRDDQIRRTYTRVFAGLVERLQAAGMDPQTALQQVVLMIGGVAVSRALDDDELVRKVLKACQLG